LHSRPGLRAQYPARDTSHFIRDFPVQITRKFARGSSPQRFSSWLKIIIIILNRGLNTDGELQWSSSSSKIHFRFLCRRFDFTTPRADDVRYSAHRSTLCMFSYNVYMSNNINYLLFILFTPGQRAGGIRVHVDVMVWKFEDLTTFTTHCRVKKHDVIDVFRVLE